MKSLICSTWRENCAERETKQAKLSASEPLEAFASEVTAQQQIGGEIFHWTVEVPENQQAHQQAQHRKAVAAKPVQVPPRPAFTHEQHDSRASVERGHRKQIEC